MFRRALALAFAVSPQSVYGLLRRRLRKIIPLNVLLGVEIVSIGDGVAQARLPFRRESTNHIGTVHATAIFGLAEAASGFALSGTFAPVILDIRPVAACANIRYVKIAKSNLVAHATILGTPSNLRATLAQDGKVSFDVDVEVRDIRGEEIARATVTWSIKQKRDGPPPSSLA